MTRRLAYQDKLRNQLKEWQDRMDRLKRHMKQAGAEGRRELEYQIEDLKAKQDAALRKLEELERTGTSAREVSRARIESTRRTLQNVVRKIVSGMR
ncbi:MAG: hypothetical protein WB783_16785 [Arenicellales bacterium]